MRFPSKLKPSFSNYSGAVWTEPVSQRMYFGKKLYFFNIVDSNPWPILFIFGLLERLSITFTAQGKRQK